MRRNNVRSDGATPRKANDGTREHCGNGEDADDDEDEQLHRTHVAPCRLSKKKSSGASERSRRTRAASDQGRGVLEYMPTGCPAGSMPRQMAPVRSVRLKGKPGTTVPPNSLTR